MRAEYLSWCLDYDSPAEAWFQSLPMAAQTDWDQLVPLFIQRWTPPPAPEKSPVEKIRELKNYRLNPDNVGKKVQYMGGTQHTHVKWARTAMGLARACNLETHMEYVDEAIDGLPNVVRRSLDRATITDWTTFTAAVRAISLDRLRENTTLEKDRQDNEKAQAHINELTTKIARLELWTSNTVAMQRTMPTPPSPQPQKAQRASTSKSTTNSTPTAQYVTNPSRTHQPQRQLTDAEKAELQQNLRKYLHQPNTDVGQATYRCQLAEWIANRGPSDYITHATPVLLKPGTADVCTSKCFKCSTHGHRAAWCELPETHPNCLSREEATWQVICGAGLGLINKAATVKVHLVLSEQEEAQTEWDAGMSDSKQGNGNGPPA
jgi:hypothetical protein